MSSSSPSFTTRERRELADLLDRLGPGAPTLCEGWDTAHLAAHLVVRERRPDAMVGLGAEQGAAGRPPRLVAAPARGRAARVDGVRRRRRAAACRAAGVVADGLAPARRRA